MKPLVHAAAGTLAIAIVSSFFVSTLAAELFGQGETIATVKRAIAYSMVLLVPLMAAVGGSGFRLSKNRTGALIVRKQLRMRVIALNGLFVLAPAAVALHLRASQGLFDATFYVVQAMELLAGALQLSLLGMNFRDGLRLSGRLARPAVTKPEAA